MPYLHGSQHPRAKLTEDLAAEIRSAYVPGVVTMRELADMAGVHLSTVSALLNGKTWAGGGAARPYGLAPSRPTDEWIL